jgi:hypothetical protein
MQTVRERERERKREGEGEGEGEEMVHKLKNVSA